MGGRKDLDPISLSQRSNGLAFSHRHFLSSSSSSALSAGLMKHEQHPMSMQLDINAPARPRAKLKLATGDLVNTGRSPTANMRQPIRSLIPPEMASERFYTNALFPHRIKRRKSESSISIKSMKSFSSTGTSRRRRHSLKETLATMPSEVLDMIFTHLAQKDLLNLMQTNSNLTEAAAMMLYNEPSFASTYRYAQFAYTVGHKKYYANMVRVLDVSIFGAEAHSERKPQAGWREWKYRNSVLHQANRERAARNGFRMGSRSSHPPPNPLLETWSLSRDLPTGGLCHAIIACERLKKVDISRLQLSSDFIVRHVEYNPTTWTGMVYVSDIQRSWTWEPKELRPIYNMYIIDQLRKLKYLETFIANSFISLSTVMAQHLVYSCPQLKWVDFRKSGMTLEQPWKIEGTREEVSTILRRLEAAMP